MSKVTMHTASPALLAALALAFACSGDPTPGDDASAGVDTSATADGDPSISGSATSAHASSSSSASASSSTGDPTSTSTSTGDPPPSCGDGEVDPGEACDDGNDLDGDACTSACAEARCGDGIVRDGVEACDDGNLDEDDGCSSACELLATCPSGLCPPTPESCPLAAQVNADIQGTTPLGPFSGGFAAFSGAIAFGQLGSMVVLPAYTDDDLCVSPPRLEIELGAADFVPSYTVQAPVRVHDGEGGHVDGIADVTVHACCALLWFCDCHSDAPFWIELAIEGEGWSLHGAASPNCCRSHSIDEAA